MAADGRTEWTDGRNGRTDDAKTISLRLCRGIKSHSVPIPSIINEKKFSNRCSFSKEKGKTKSNHEVLGLWQRSFRLHDVITF